jgi:hypothetical protein
LAWHPGSSLSDLAAGPDSEHIPVNSSVWQDSAPERFGTAMESCFFHSCRSPSAYSLPAAAGIVAVVGVGVVVVAAVVVVVVAVVAVVAAAVVVVAAVAVAAAAVVVVDPPGLDH